MAKINFTVEQLDYLEAMFPPMEVGVNSTQAEFIHNVVTDNFRKRINAMRDKAMGVRYTPQGAR